MALMKQSRKRESILIMGLRKNGLNLPYFEVSVECLEGVLMPLASVSGYR